MKSAEAYEHEQGWDFEKAAMPYVDSLYNTAYRMTRNSEDAEDLSRRTSTTTSSKRVRTSRRGSSRS
jgi:DNA-directed RNA polymerase specialized sigma24 family protein